MNIEQARHFTGLVEYNNQDTRIALDDDAASPHLHRLELQREGQSVQHLLDLRRMNNGSFGTILNNAIETLRHEDRRGSSAPEVLERMQDQMDNEVYGRSPVDPTVVEEPRPDWAVGPVITGTEIRHRLDLEPGSVNYRPTRPVDPEVVADSVGSLGHSFRAHWTAIDEHIHGREPSAHDVSISLSYESSEVDTNED